MITAITAIPSFTSVSRFAAKSASPKTVGDLAALFYNARSRLIYLAQRDVALRQGSPLSITAIPFPEHDATHALTGWLTDPDAELCRVLSIEFILATENLREEGQWSQEGLAPFSLIKSVALQNTNKVRQYVQQHERLSIPEPDEALAKHVYRVTEDHYRFWKARGVNFALLLYPSQKKEAFLNQPIQW